MESPTFPPSMARRRGVSSSAEPVAEAARILSPTPRGEDGEGLMPERLSGFALPHEALLRGEMVRAEPRCHASPRLSAKFS